MDLSDFVTGPRVLINKRLRTLDKAINKISVIQKYKTPYNYVAYGLTLCLGTELRIQALDPKGKETRKTQESRKKMINTGIPT